MKRTRTTGTENHVGLTARIKRLAIETAAKIAEGATQPAQKEMRGPVEGKSRAGEYQPRGDTAHPGECGTGLSETTSQTQPNTELGGPGQACKGSPEKERTHEAKGANVLNDILEGTSSSDTEEHQYGTAAQAEQTGGGRADDGNEGQGERTSTEGSTDIGGALSEEEQAEQIRIAADLEDLTDQMGSLSNNTARQ